MIVCLIYLLMSQLSFVIGWKSDWLNTTNHSITGSLFYFSMNITNSNVLYCLFQRPQVVYQRWRTERSYFWPRPFQTQLPHRQLWINWPVYNNTLWYDNSNSAVPSPSLLLELTSNLETGIPPQRLNSLQSLFPQEIQSKLYKQGNAMAHKYSQAVKDTCWNSSK